MCKELNLDKNIDKKGKKHISTIDFNQSNDPREEFLSCCQIKMDYN